MPALPTEGWKKKVCSGLAPHMTIREQNFYTKTDFPVGAAFFMLSNLYRRPSFLTQNFL
jgi:hypothetical protein